ncbi:MAG: phosphodiester glycosidase family protein [Lachnospiraceae bacterium]|nr:phosphodiester glycosidase family protein [Lachnospiraceae bacterium]
MKKRKKTKESIGHRLLRYVGRFFLWFFCTLAVLLAGAYLFFLYINKGPSEHFRDLFVTSAMESSAGGILAQIYLSDEEIDAIRQRNQVSVLTEVTDPTLVHVLAADKAEAAAALPETDAAAETPVVLPADPDGDGIELHEVHGPMYSGKMMIVHDPSRVHVSAISNFTHSGGGWTLQQHVENSGAVAGINGGKYEDASGLGIGGWPEGLVISNGELRMGDPGATYGVYGFTDDNVLVVGNMTAGQAISMGVRDAVTFGPALIVNGKSAGYQGIGSGLNPRTAIGQRADGAVLLLVIEGRKTSSLGAAMSDLIEVMQEYGAVNAANLDGGMSSSMIYNGEMVVSNCQLRDERRMPTAFVVYPADENGITADTSLQAGARSE